MPDLLPPTEYSVAVRTLCEFTARRGDLDLRFTPAPTARQGIDGHQRVAARRGAGYQAEVALSGRWRHLAVRGRADGYDPQAQRLDEVKTHRGRLDTPAHHRALHQAQLWVYGHLMCEQQGLARITLALVYFDITEQHETVFSEVLEAPVLREFFERQCAAFAGWADAELAHRTARDAALHALGFPHPEFRSGQRALARAVYTSQRDGGCLLAQAPTGIGKTVATLFASLKAVPGQAIDKLFYLTAKTSGRRLALEALVALAGAPAAPAAGAPGRLRTLELVARDKACEHPDAQCDGASCPLARGFYDRLPAARAQAVHEAALDAARLRVIARDHAVCPYYLGQELARWSDVIVGDVNHYFDTSALLYGLSSANDWRVGVLVDEAHNLVERARAMYTASLDERRLRDARRRLRRQAGGPGTSAPIARALDRVARQWRAQLGTGEQPYRILERPAAGLVGALQELATTLTDQIAERPREVDAQLRELLFDCLRFVQAAERFGDHSLFDATLIPSAARGRRNATVLCLRNVVPAPFIGPRVAAAHATTLFSATLEPWHFIRDTLGLPAETRCLDVPSPFDPAQLAVHVVDSVSTRYRDRQHAVPPIVGLIARQYAQRPGNYLVFASSFEFLDTLSLALAEQHPGLRQSCQRPAMSEPQRDAFVAGFTADSRQIGFAVLGGVFGEGIDLPGDRLIGAFIATLGLPPPDPVNEAMRARLQQTFGDGYGLAYLYPGLQKVVQAAGRVIRSEHDRGVLHLIDDRFARADVRRLLPRWWSIGGRSRR